MARLRDRLLRIFGDIKVFPHPLWLVYDPGSYRVKGRDMREVIDLVRPGDVLVRGFDRYLDGKFIPGHFSHAAVYLGPVGAAELAAAPDRGRKALREGEQIVLHAIAEGVVTEDLLDFCRCDRLAVLRFPALLRAVPRAALPDRTALRPAERALFDRLVGGGTVSWDEAWPVVKGEALAQLGARYDFDFDFTDVRRLSCTELVHRATRALAPFLGVAPREHRILFLRGTGITPDAFVASPLELVWVSPSANARRVAALRAKAPAVPAEVAADAA